MEGLPTKEGVNVNLSEQQKSFIITVLENDLANNLDIYDDSKFADELNDLYRKLTGKNHSQWFERRNNAK